MLLADQATSTKIAFRISRSTDSHHPGIRVYKNAIFRGQNRHVLAIYNSTACYWKKYLFDTQIVPERNTTITLIYYRRLAIGIIVALKISVDAGNVYLQDVK